MPTVEFVDPRTSPAPPWRGDRRPLASGPDELQPVIQSITRGRIYEVEAWVRAGHPIQFATPKVRPWTKQSPLEAAQDPARMDEAQFLRLIASPRVLERAPNLGVRRANLDALIASPSFSTSVVAAARRAVRKNRDRAGFVDA